VDAPQGSFARSRTAQIIDDYLNQVEALSPRLRRPFVLTPGDAPAA